MPVLFAVGSVVLILVVLLDSFESMVLPRRVTRRFRLTRLFYRYTWRPFSYVARRLKPGKLRETCLSVFGPLSTLVLLILWAATLVTGFALLHWSLGLSLGTPGNRPGLSSYLYMSGETFSTLGYGDITPQEPLGRFLAVTEAGLGFGFLAVIIGYLPVLFQAFSRREVNISLLDARAGSPPSAAQLLLRQAQARDTEALHRFLEEWERWAAELLESHLSFPVLSYYRSQHDNQSWLAALTAILDTCALVIAGVRDTDPYQAQLTFAMARHAAVDLALVFHTPPRAPDPDRLPPDRLVLLRAALQQAGLPMREGKAVEQRLTELRAMYEPFVNSLAGYFLFTLPPILPETAPVDNWQTSAWTRRVAGIGKLALPDSASDDHFD